MNYSDVRVLVTGADGFIGSHLTEALMREGARVRAFCLYNSNGSRGWLDGLEPSVANDIDFQLGDIRDSRFVEAACQDVEVVFHLAALIAIPYSYHAPESFLDTNVRGTLNVLEAAHRAKCNEQFGGQQQLHRHDSRDTRVIQQHNDQQHSCRDRQPEGSRTGQQRHHGKHYHYGKHHHSRASRSISDPK